MSSSSYSICVVTNDENKLKGLSDSVKMSFDNVEHEIITADGNSMDIFSGYNDAAGRANGDYLVFVHQDVEFLNHSFCWEQVSKYLAKPATGVIGVAGTAYMSRNGMWWLPDVQNTQNALHGAAMHGDEFGNEWMTTYGPYGQVVTLDGVCLVMRKNLWSRLGGFDEKTYSGFDFYDIDITLRSHLAGYHNYAMPILLKHYSPGDISNREGWHANRVKFLAKFSKELPVIVQ